MVSSMYQPMGADLTDRKVRGRSFFVSPEDKPDFLTVDREHVSRGPSHLKENRVVEILEPLRRDQDPSPREPRRSSRSANPRHHDVVTSQKSILGFHPLLSKPS